MSQSLKNGQQKSSAALQENLEQLEQMRLNAAMVLDQGLDCGCKCNHRVFESAEAES